MRGNFLYKIIDRHLGIILVWILGLFANRSTKIPDEIGTILVIKLSAMGDTVLLIPVLRALKKKFPNSKLNVIGTKINQDVLRACPYIDVLTIINIKKILINPFAIFDLFKDKKFDIALDFDQWTRISPLLAFMSGAGFRVGFKTKGQHRHFLYNSFVEHSRTKHESDCFFDVLKMLGIDETDRKLEFWVDDVTKQHAENFLLENGYKKGEKYIVFHPETPAHGGQRQWPVANYIELGRKIQKMDNYRIVIAGTEREKVQNLQIVNALAPKALLLPSMKLGEYASVLERAEMLICGNTGIMHLAAAMNVPVIALHGPTDPQKWGPLGEKSVVIRSKLPCSPCLYLGFEYGCSSNKCMQDIGVEEVFQTLLKVANSIPN